MQPKHMKHIIRSSAWLALTVLATATSGLYAEEQTAKNQSALRVGVTPNMPPMIFKEGKKVVGVEADFAQLVGRELGRPVKFVELPWPDLIDSLEANKIDIIMSSMSVTRARQTRVAFSEPYLRIGQMALVRADEKFLFSLPRSSIASQTIGVTKATTGDLLVQQEFPRAKRKCFDSGDQAAKALTKKKIDIYFSDSTMIWYLAGKYETEGLVAAPVIYTDEVLAWAMRRSDTELMESVNKALRDMNASGELKRILKRWIPRFE
jgi:polar amino acid transport system substrate-binding protein